jgi:hypothetical protein
MEAENRTDPMILYEEPLFWGEFLFSPHENRRNLVLILGASPSSLQIAWDPVQQELESSSAIVSFQAVQKSFNDLQPGVFLATLLPVLDEVPLERLTSMNQSDSVLSPVLNSAALSEGATSIDVRNLRSRSRFEAMELPSLGSREEALVVDERSELRPAQVVESKLTRLLQDASLPVSHLQMRRLLRTR